MQFWQALRPAFMTTRPISLHYAHACCRAASVEEMQSWTFKSALLLSRSTPLFNLQYFHWRPMISIPCQAQEIGQTSMAVVPTTNTMRAWILILYNGIVRPRPRPHLNVPQTSWLLISNGSVGRRSFSLVAKCLTRGFRSVSISKKEGSVGR
jgi:hypothetical protein